MSYLRRYISSASMLAVQGVFQKILGIFSTIILARNLNSRGFGLFNALIITVNSGYGLVKLGLDGAIHVRMADKDDSDKGNVLGAGLVLLSLSGLIAAPSVFVFSDQLASLIFKEPELTRWIKYAAVLIFVQCLTQFLYATLVGLHRFAFYSVTMVIMSCANLAALYIGIVLGGLQGAVLAVVFIKITTLVLFITYLKRYLQQKRLRFEYDRFRETAIQLLKLGFPFYMVGFVTIPVAYYMYGILSASAGVENLGYMRIVVSINSIILFVPSSIAAATISFLSEANTDIALAQEKFVVYSQLNLKTTWYFCLSIGVILWIFVPTIIRIAFGKQYLVAVTASRLGLFAAIFMVVMNVASNTYFAQKKVSLIFVQNAVYSVGFFAIGVLLVPRWGILGFVFSELIGYFAVAVFVVLLFHLECRSLGMNPNFHWFLLVMTAAAALVLSVVNVLGNELLEYVCGTGVLIAILISGYLLIFSPKEREAFSLYINQLFRKGRQILF